MEVVLAYFKDIFSFSQSIKYNGLCSSHQSIKFEEFGLRIEWKIERVYMKLYKSTCISFDSCCKMESHELHFFITYIFYSPTSAPCAPDSWSSVTVTVSSGEYFTSEDVYEHNSVLDFSCSSGTLEGASSTACDNGAWSPDASSVTCNRKLNSFLKHFRLPYLFLNYHYEDPHSTHEMYLLSNKNPKAMSSESTRCWSILCTL